MGLDMYLSRRSYVKNWNHNEKKFAVSVQFDGKQHPFINLGNVKYIEEETGYWRKANAIHNWIIQNIANGEDEFQEIHLTESELKWLRQDCVSVLGDHSLADELLPTTSGFFFGGKDYDEYYFEQLGNTINIIDNTLVDPDTLPCGIYSPSYIYQASW